MLLFLFSEQSFLIFAYLYHLYLLLFRLLLSSGQRRLAREVTDWIILEFDIFFNSFIESLLFLLAHLILVKARLPLTNVIAETLLIESKHESET
jgi:hypothetical protein